MSTDLTSDQIDFFAAGLYQLAAVDGVDDNEVAFIQEFLKEAGREGQAVDALEFDSSMLPWVFDSSFLRRVFLKACWALVKADKKVTPKERNMITAYAEELGLLNELATLEQSADVQSL